jgi:hypothetical protein
MSNSEIERDSPVCPKLSTLRPASRVRDIGHEWAFLRDDDGRQQEKDRFALSIPGHIADLCAKES